MQGEKEVIKDIEEKKEKALNISMKEGAVNSFAGSIGDSFATPFALALKATPLHIGILNSIVSLISPIAQWYGNNLMEKQSRKHIILKFIVLQILFTLPLALLGFLVWKGYFVSSAVYILITSYTLISICIGVSYSTWFSWMGDLVAPENRGKYFSKRNMLTGTVSIIALLIGGFVLDTFKTKGLVLVGFSILFLASSLFRTISYRLIKKQYAPEFKLHKRDYFSLLDFVKRFDNFGKFAVYYAIFNFSLMIASPFFSVYMLEELKFSYITFMIVTLSSSVFYIIFSPIIGKFSDKYGNRKLLFIGTFLISFNPLLWLIIKQPIFLVLIPNLLVGIANAALSLGITNFTYDASKPQHRALCVSYSNILAGIGAFFGALLGGLLLKYSLGSLNIFFFVFLISGILRLLSSILLLKNVKEIKKVKRFPGIHIPHIHAFKTIHTEIESFSNFTHHTYTEGLKIWNPSLLNVLQKESKKKTILQ